MFRLSNLLKTTLEDTPQRELNGTIAIWNFTNRCNLNCLHCYSKSSPYGEDTLSTRKIFEIIDQLKEGGVKFIIFSGGEPLIRKDIFKIASYCKEKGIFTYLSSNGLYITPNNAKEIVESFGYIGISIDGDEKTHNYFRGLEGAYKRSLKSIEYIHQAGGKVGLRFTITKATKESLPHIFELAKKEGVDKLYISHLVYSGRGLDNLKMDLTKEERKEAVEYIISQAFENRNLDIVTGNMEMDAIAFLEEFGKRYPTFKEKLLQRLKKWGGNSAGRRLVNIDSEGNVKPDPFFPITLGNLFENSFKKIWENPNNPTLQKLREFPRKLKGKCEGCKWIDICNGGSRPRAWAIYGDLWAEDPSCYVGE